MTTIKCMILASRTALGVAALIAFLLAVAAHLAATGGIDVEAKWPEVWLLHYGLLPFILVTAITAAWLAGPPHTFRHVTALIPLVARVAIGVAFLYALANFFYVVLMTGGGDPIVGGGRYAFNDHGVVREVTEQQFHAARSLSIRAFSGHWVFLYLVSTIFLLTAKPMQHYRP